MVCRETCTGKSPSLPSRLPLLLTEWGCGAWPFTLNKLERLKQANCLEYISMG